MAQMEKFKRDVSSTIKSFFTDENENKEYYSSVQHNVLYESLNCQTFRTSSRKLLKSFSDTLITEFLVFEKGVRKQAGVGKSVKDSFLVC